MQRLLLCSSAHQLHPKTHEIDTEALVQMLVPYKEAILARKDAPTRSDYNDWV